MTSIVEQLLGAAGDRSRFADRHDAGRRLAALLEPYRQKDAIVVGVPRGGVAVAAEVARVLDKPLDVVVVRKIGAPMNPEYAIGAVAEGGVCVLGHEAIRALRLDDVTVGRAVERAQEELAVRLALYRADRSPLPVRGRTVVLVDDGLATGRSALAAVRSLRERGAARVVLAVPVAARDPAAEVHGEVDELVSVEAPHDLGAIGLWYKDFRPTSDLEVRSLLAGRAPHSSS